MSTTQINPRRFKDFYGNPMASIGNYQQDLKTGELLASQIVEAIQAPKEHLEPIKNTRLTALVNRLPKGNDFNNNGLIIGLFAGLSASLEPIFKENPLQGEPCSQQSSLDFISESAEYADQFNDRVRVIIEQWSINFSCAVNDENYQGIERYLLSGLVLDLPKAFDFVKSPYTCFCFNLMLLLKKSLPEQAVE
ncbi:hypothetical protein ACLKMH_15540 [Psychromonas sp. KJ10-10]|uniref:hypothetical protein n=1 Tax=Psychromonas sp. KJ10-10 TaxID=3391823 RepID=UPI0039B41A40